MVGDQYQYNEDDFRIEFLFLLSFQTAWIHKNMEQRKAVNLKSFTLITCKLVIQN